VDACFRQQLSSDALCFKEQAQKQVFNFSVPQYS